MQIFQKQNSLLLKAIREMNEREAVVAAQMSNYVTVMKMKGEEVAYNHLPADKWFL